MSWFSDYQARRAGIRYRPAGGGPNRICDTFNGSALAVPRVWAALVETYRQPDGTGGTARGARPLPARGDSNRLSGVMGILPGKDLDDPSHARCAGPTNKR